MKQSVTDLRAAEPQVSILRPVWRRCWGQSLEKRESKRENVLYLPIIFQENLQNAQMASLTQVLSSREYVTDQPARLFYLWFRYMFPFQLS